MKNKMHIFYITLIAMILIIIICIVYFFANHNPSNGHTTPQKVIVGWIGPLSGSAKVLGIDNLKAVQLAFAEYRANNNNIPVELMVANDQYNTHQCITEYKKMAELVTAVFISTYSCISALAKDAEEDSVIIINPIDNDANLANLNTPWKANIFLIAKETEGLATIVASALIAQEKKNTLVIYYEGDNFMPTLALTLEKILTQNGKKVHLLKYKQGETNFHDSLSWGKKHQVDSYVFFGYVEMGLAMRKAREMGIKEPFYSVNVISDPLFLENSKGFANGTFFAHFTSADGIQSNAEKFKMRYWQKYHTYPIVEWTALQAYDASNILLTSIKEAANQKGIFTDNLTDILRHISDYQGVSGTISILPNGSSKGIYPTLYILKNGKPVRVR